MAGSPGDEIIIYEDNNICYWVQDGQEFIAGVWDNKINLYYNDHLFFSYTDFDGQGVVATAYNPEGKIIKQTRHEADTRAYRISKTLLNYFNNKS